MNARPDRVWLLVIKSDGNWPGGMVRVFDSPEARLQVLREAVQFRGCDSLGLSDTQLVAAITRSGDTCILAEREVETLIAGQVYPPREFNDDPSSGEQSR